MRTRLGLLLCASLVGSALGLTATVPAAAQEADPCANQEAIAVPGAEKEEVNCFDDLSAVALSARGRSDAGDWSALYSKSSTNPPAGAGIQIDGYFPDDSTTNTTYRWNHDSQFVIRLPAQWNGQLVVSGAPGVRRQYANDFIISDFVLSQGYAYASTDKGNTGLAFFENGERSAPGQAVQEWHSRVTELALAAKQVVQQRYGRPADRTFMTGISNGGYLTRWQLENRPDLYDGGVDWEGTLFLAEGPNLFTYLPTALREFPRSLVDPAAKQRMFEAGFEPGSEILWPDHYSIYWDITQRVYREAFDPGYDGDKRGGSAFCRSGGEPDTESACDADYDYASRPQSVKDAMASVELTGNIGKPMVTLHGDKDALLPIDTDSNVYTQMIADAGKGGMHRYYVIEDGNHVDDRFDLYPTEIRPILPCYREAFARLTSWVTTGEEPPASQTVERPLVGDVANTCPQLAAAVVAQPEPTSSPTASPSASPSTAPGGGSGGAPGTASTSGAAPTRSARALPATGPAALLPVLAALAIAGAAVTRRRR